MKQIVVILILLSASLFSQDEPVRKWEQIDLPTVTIPFSNQQVDLDAVTMLDIHFLESNKNYGWISGFESVILRTTDGGETWIPSFVDNLRRIQTESVWFLNENVGYASGPVNDSRNPNRPANQFMGAVYKSIDGGATWTEITPFLRFTGAFGQIILGSTNIWGLYFLDENNGWVMGGNCSNPRATLDFGEQNMFFYKTTDGGQTWTLVAKNTEEVTKLSDLIMYPNGNGYAVSSGLIWETNDFGDSWERMALTGGFDWHEDISIFNNSIAIPYSVTCSGSLDDNGGIRVTTDFGETWTDYNTGHDMYGAYMHSDQRAFAVGRGNSLFQTQDGGENWFIDNFCLEDVFLDDLYYVEEETIWTVGDGIYKSYFDIVVNLDEVPDTVYACRGEEVIFEIDPQYVRYEWIGTNNFTRKISAIADGEKTFKASYFDDLCPDTIFTKEFVLISNPDPEVNVEIEPELACVGEEYTVTVTSEVPFVWVDANTGQTFSNEEVITIDSEREIRLEYTSDIGCEYSDVYEFEFAPLPDPNIFTDEITDFCVGESSMLQLEGDYPGIIWKSIEKGVVQEGGASFEAMETGEFYVVAENEFGCIDSSNIIPVNVRNDTNQLDFSARYTGEFLRISDPLAGQQSCGYVLIENFSWKELTLENPSLFQNQEFSIPADQLPLEIEPFGIDSLYVCFKSNENGLREDTLYIPDLCEDHFIPINGNVAFVDFDSESRCELDVVYTRFGETDFYTIFFGTPYPNPAKDFTFAEFVEFEPDGAESQVRGELLDQLGNKISDAVVSIKEQSPKNDGFLRHGELFFDTSELINGAYQLVFISPTQTQSFTIVVSR